MGGVAAGHTARKCHEEYNPRVISPDLLEILVCPVCREPLTLKENGAGLRCTKCAKAYPIRDGLPILLAEEAISDSIAD